jgi:nitrite reductase (NADH) small subunit
VSRSNGLVDVGGLADYAERSARIVSVEGVEIGVFRWRGEEVYALRNVCPHMGGPVCAGRLSALIRPGVAPGELEADPDTPVIACSWHRWEFDVRTGRSIQPSTYRVRTYRVTVRRGRILVDFGRRRAAKEEAQP